MINESKRKELDSHWDELECCKDRVLEKWNTRYTENPSEINSNAPDSGENNSGE